MSIPKSFISELLSRINIVEVISSRISIKKKGKDYSACCPFHGEKTPSFTVSLDKQFYHCFGCGEHGNVIDFIIKYENLGFIDAIDELASLAGLEVPRRSNTSAESISSSLYDLTQEVTKLFSSNLSLTPLSKNSDEYKQSKIANDYLLNRGLSPESIKSFSIGFAYRHDFLIKKLGKHKDLLVKIGLLKKSDYNGSFYDYFKSRVIFPIKDIRGRVVGFGGRLIESQPNKPKYLNSPETVLFSKSKELYGLYELRLSSKKIPKALLVEGYMDVVSLHTHGINYAVASLGTATTSEQIKTIFRFTSDIYFCYDGDEAGIKAAWRCLENCLPVVTTDKSVNFMFLPKGEDPDSFVKKYGKDKFEAKMLQSIGIVSFILQKLQKTYSIESGSLAKNSLLLAEKIQDNILRETLLEELSRKLRFNNLAELKRKFNIVSKPKTKQSYHKEKKRNPIDFLICLLIHKPGLGYNLQCMNFLLDIDSKKINLLVTLIDLVRHDKSIKTCQLLEHFRDQDEKFKFLCSLSRVDIELSGLSLTIEFYDTLVWLIDKYLENRFYKLREKPNLSKIEQMHLKKLIDVIRH